MSVEHVGCSRPTSSRVIHEGDGVPRCSMARKLCSPPGTGKTTTVVALILEAVAREWRCLVCAPSNVAVDGILEKLLAAEEGVPGGKSDGGGKGRRPRVVRLGHPARLLPQVKCSCPGTSGVQLVTRWDLQSASYQIPYNEVRE